METTSAADGTFAFRPAAAGLHVLDVTPEDAGHVARGGVLAQVAPGLTTRNLIITLTRGDGRIVTEGLGVKLSLSPGAVRVIKLHPGSDAVTAGLHVGDVLLKADGVSLGSLDNDEVNSRLLGPEGSMVILTVQREGRELEVRVFRRKLTWPR